MPVRARRACCSRLRLRGSGDSCPSSCAAVSAWRGFGLIEARQTERWNFWNRSSAAFRKDSRHAISWRRLNSWRSFDRARVLATFNVRRRREPSRISDRYTAVVAYEPCEKGNPCTPLLEIFLAEDWSERWWQSV